MNHPSDVLKLKARTVLMGKYIPSISTMITTLAISTLLSWLLDISGFSMAGDTLQKICYLIMNLVILLLEGLISIGLSYFFLEMAQGRPFIGKQLFYCFSHDPDRFLLAAGFRYSCMLLGWVPAAVYFFNMPPILEASAGNYVTLLCLALLAILLNLPVRLYLGQSYYILLEDPDCGIMEAMRRSISLVEGRKRQLFFLYLSFLGFKLLELGTMGIGSLWSRPYVEMTKIQFYLDLTGRDPLAEAAENPQKTQTE